MNKACTLSEAVKSIPHGSHVSLSGFAITRCNMAFAAEIIRQQISDLTISQCVGAMDADLLVGAKMVKRLIYGGGSLDRFGRLACVNRGIEDGSLQVDEYSSLSIAFRYLAGSLGLPFITIRSLQGSDLLNQLKNNKSQDVAECKDPFTGNRWLALKPLIPDVAVVQVQVADNEGNSWILGPRWDNAEQVKASIRAIVITEKMVSTEEIRQFPERTVIPGLKVSHVVELPYSAHPTSVFGSYDYDAKHIQLYVEAAKSPDGLIKYLDDFVLTMDHHNDYLEKIGGQIRLSEITADKRLGY
jgi:acyl CoA:acetate/3-ketoacid CoA transferase alpha subunit